MGWRGYGQVLQRYSMRLIKNMSYIIYHPKRNSTKIESHIIYHDVFGRNEDPYIWNDKFLHSFCHMTQITPQIGDIIFWCSGNSYPDFTELVCDCVFLVKEKVYWKSKNEIQLTDIIVDNEQAFEKHYKWVNPPNNEHYFKRRKKRFTLKADMDKSFQPQNINRRLIDIIPFLNTLNIPTESLVNSIAKTRNGKPSRNSRPYKLSAETARNLYDFLDKSDIKIKGYMIKDKHPIKITTSP